MTQPTYEPAAEPALEEQPDPHTVIAAALDDWWITTDPAQPFHTLAVADHLETYLTDYGYTITPNPPRTPVPRRRAITAAAFITLVSAGSVYLAAHRGDWWWAALGTIATLLLTRETVRDLADRRHHRNAR